MEKLSIFLKSRGVSQEVFAARIGISQGSLSKICTGANQPKLETALRIAAETGGEVPVESWHRPAVQQAS